MPPKRVSRFDLRDLVTGKKKRARTRFGGISGSVTADEAVSDQRKTRKPASKLSRDHIMKLARQGVKRVVATMNNVIADPFTCRTEESKQLVIKKVITQAKKLIDDGSDSEDFDGGKQSIEKTIVRCLRTRVDELREEAGNGDDRAKAMLSFVYQLVAEPTDAEKRLEAAKSAALGLRHVCVACVFSMIENRH
jgi:hypothetical protein